MGLFGSIFGMGKASAKAVDNGFELLNTAGKGIDMMFYTDEEKAIGKMKWYDMWLKGQAVLKGESSARALTRRYLAWTFATVYLGVFVVLVALMLLGLDVQIIYSKDGKEILTTINKIDKVIELMSVLKMGVIMLTIIIFYFGYYSLEKVIGKFKGGDAPAYRPGTGTRPASSPEAGVHEPGNHSRENK